MDKKMNTMLKPVPKEGKPTGKKQPPHMEIKERQSKEIIIGFAGAVGSGSKTVIDLVKDILLDQNYNCNIIKISDYIEACRSDGIFDIELDETIKSIDPKFYRYRALQKGGNILRKKSQDYILAEYAITQIAQGFRTRASALELNNLFSIPSSEKSLTLRHL